MKSTDVECNKTYWSTRYRQSCVCTAVARYFVRLEFANPQKNGWYHCQEIKNLPKSQENIIDISDLIR